MKGFKCFGLLSAFFTIFGLSFVVCSDTNALKYSIDTIDFSNPTYEFRKLQLSDGVFPIMFSRFHNFSVGFNKDISVPNGFTFPHTWRFTGRYLSSSNSCELNRYSDGVYVTSYSSGDKLYSQSLDSFSFNYHNFILDDSPFDLSQSLSSGNNSWLVSYDSNNLNSPLCHMTDFSYYDISETPPFAYANYPRWNWGSLGTISLFNNRFKYEDSKPYTYNYDKLYLQGKDKVNGVVVNSNGLSTDSLFNTVVPDVSYYNMNFSLFDSPVNRLDYEGSPEANVRNFTFGGSIYFNEDYTFKTSGCYQNPSCISLQVDSVDYSSSASSSDVLRSAYTLPDGSSLYAPNYNTLTISSCAISQYHISDGAGENRVDFNCTYDPSTLNNPYISNSIDFRNLNVSLIFGSLDDVLIHTSSWYRFQNFYVITNNNWTEAGDWTASDSGSGGAVYDSPGAGNEGDFVPNFNASLTSMFTFGFFNPFAPIFQMFADNNSCASIPTLSGMLYSEETTVCPWFDSTTRNIVTPVLGLSSMMLVFGFAVRWLGSSSGNLFEDSRHEEVSNQGGRSGHFKKGGS